MFKTIFGVDVPKQLDQLGNAARPAGLMACSKPCTVVTMKIFIKENEISPVRVGLELLCATVHRPSTVLIAEKHA
jgi:hypothetical protein